MAVVSRSFTVTDAAPVLVYRAKGDNARPSQAILWLDDAADVIFLGGPNVTNAGANKGIPVAQSDRHVRIEGIEGDWFYAIATAGQSATLVVMSNGE